MPPKRFIIFCVVVGSSIGAYVPAIWGAGMLSFSSIIFSAFGGLLGIYVAVRLGR